MMTTILKNGLQPSRIPVEKDLMMEKMASEAIHGALPFFQSRLPMIH